MATSASPFSPRGGRDPHATPAALSALIDRARDERFRLLSLLKDARAQLADARPAPQPQAAAVNPQLIAAVDRLNTELKDRVDELESAEARLAARLDVVQVDTVVRAEAEARRRIDAVVRSAEQRIAGLASGIATQLETAAQSIDEAAPAAPRLVGGDQAA